MKIKFDGMEKEEQSINEMDMTDSDQMNETISADGDKVKNFSLAFSISAPKNEEILIETSEAEKVIKLYNAELEYYYFGIFNHHGSSGQEIMLFVKKFITSHLENNKVILKKLEDRSKIKGFLLEMIELAEKKLFKKKIDYKYSGCTLNHIFTYKNIAYTINVGNCKSFMFRKRRNDKFTIDLSTDHVPECKDERFRIYKNGGIIKRWEVDGAKVGPLRIWDKKIENGPGIRVTRSVGDSVATRLGVISKPDIESIEITTSDVFLCVGNEEIFNKLYSTQISYYISKFFSLFPQKIDQCSQFIINKIRSKKFDVNRSSYLPTSNFQIGNPNLTEDGAIIIAFFNFY